MKRLRSSRKQILRAIHFACLALFFAACAQRAEATPSYTSGDYAVNGSTVTALHSDTSTGYFNDTSSSTYNISVGAGLSLGNSNPGTFSGNLLQFSTGSVSNAGTLTAIGPDAIYISTGPGTVLNSGSITASATYGIQIKGAGTVSNYQSGSILGDTSGLTIGGNGTVSNAGSITGSAAYGIRIQGTGFSTVSNDRSGTIMGGVFGLVIDGNATVINAGSITGSSVYGIHIEGAGPSSVTNTGSIRGGDFGLVIAGNATVTNAGSITGSNVYGVRIEGTGFSSVSNTGSILGGDFGLTVVGNATVLNSGSITGSAAYGVHIEGAGLSTVTNTGSILGGDFGLVIAGNATLTNAGSITGSNVYGVHIEGTGASSVTNTGSIFGGDFGLSIAGTGTVTNTKTITGGVFGLVIGGNGTVANSGTITGSSNYGVQIRGTGASSVSNYGKISGGGSGLTIAGNSTVINTGTITGSSNYGVRIEGTGFSSVSNTGSILGGDFGLGIAGNGTVLNSGTITGSNVYGIRITGAGASTVTNTGSILGSGFGLVIAGNATVTNAGLITGSNFYGVHIQGTGASSVTNTGSILGGNFGLSIAGNGTVLNSGTISGSVFGLKIDRTGMVTLDGGFEHGGSEDAVLVNGGGGTPSTVNVNGRTNLTYGFHGLVDGSGGPGTLNLNLVGATPAEVAALKAAVGQTHDTLVIGGETYDWVNFDLTGATAVSLEQVVDPGLVNIAKLIDTYGLPANTGIGSVGAQFDLFYDAALTNPEAAMNLLVGREFDGAFSSIALNNATSFADLIDGHSFTGGLDFTGLTINSSSMIASLGQTQSLLGKLMGSSAIGGTTMSDSKDDIATPDQRWGGWVSGTLTLADESNTFTSPGYNAATESPTIGVDYRLARDLTVGGLFNYATTGAYFSDGSRLDAQNELLGGYANWSHGPWYVNGLVGGGLTQYDNKRTTFSGPQAQSDPSGSEILADLTAGYEFKVGAGWRVSPEAGLEYTHVEEDAYAETGAKALDLNIGQQDVDSLRTKLGFRATDNFRWDSISFTPQFHAAWYHECLDDSRGVTTSLSGAPALGSFIVSTTTPERDFALVGAGLSATPSELHDDVTFFLNYDAQVGQANYIAHTVNGGLKVDF